ncbi:MAG: GxxExxY protein [Candidatus Marinimicrobia bacterium]|nr:GxxExxY protein [Candidatus Neomarinimicrobiota bacterium]
MNENSIAEIIVDCAYHIHVKTGPGLFESVYELILAEHLRSRGLSVKRQCPVSINFEDLKFGKAFIADMTVENKVIIELKSKEKLNSVDKKQLLTYLKMTGLKLGLLINFGESRIKDGIKRIINGDISTEI